MFQNHSIFNDLKPQEAAPIFVKLLQKYGTYQQQSTVERILAKLKFSMVDVVSSDVQERLAALLVRKPEILELVLADAQFKKFADSGVKGQYQKVLAAAKQRKR